MSTADKGRRRDALTIGVQDRIVSLIKGWKTEWGEFNASALERKVTCCLDIKCTRQGLLKKEAIRTAFDERMKLRQGKAPKERSAEEAVLRQRIERLESELIKKTEQLEHAHEILIRFRQNAKLMGLPAERLEAPIAPLVGGNQNSA